MREYGRVESTFWTSPTTQPMSGDGKLLALYLLTGPHSTALGCYRVPDGYVMEDLAWEMERVAEGFRELSAKGWANRCETTKWVLINNHLKFNPPDNPNQCKNLHRLAAQVPENFTHRKQLEAMISQYVGESTQIPLPLNPNGSKTLNQTPAKPFRNQEQEQEQEQNSQNHHAFGAAMIRWAAVKLELQKQLEPADYNLWVKPAYLLKLMGGGILVALPANGRVIDAAKANQDLWTKAAAKQGFAGVSFTRYPDEHELQRLKKENPEFFAQFSPALQKKAK
jgi:hypothetical protein